MDIKQLTQVFKENANPEYAAKMQAYLKDKFLHFGLKSPLRKSIQKPFLSEIKAMTKFEVIELIKQLYALPQREFHYFAIEALDKKVKELTIEDLPFLEFLIQTNTWWDSVDAIATHFFTPVLQQFSIEERMNYVEKLAGHENMWMNRVGIIYQLPLKKETNTEILEFAILAHIDSKEFFLRKAIGWALRQYSKYNPAYVQTFVDNYPMSTLSKREATKYL